MAEMLAGPTKDKCPDIVIHADILVTTVLLVLGSTIM